MDVQKDELIKLELASNVAGWKLGLLLEISATKSAKLTTH